MPNVNCQPDGIVTGPDGNLWCVEFAGNKIAKIQLSPAQLQFSAAATTLQLSQGSGTITITRSGGSLLGAARVEDHCRWHGQGRRQLHRR